MNNCWTCTHDMPPVGDIPGHACARLDEDPEPRDVRAWVERTALDDETQMPAKDAAACPGWVAKDGQGDPMLDPEKVREHLRSRGFYTCGFRGAPSDRRRGYVRVWWSAGGWRTLRGLHVQIVIPTDPGHRNTFADSVRDALNEIGIVRDAGRWVAR